MFGRKTGGDVKKSAIKVLDPKKDPLTRLKHLRIVLDSYEVVDAKSFFEQNYSPIYYIFHDCFTTVEGELKQRANRSHKEELENVMFIFEKILTLLPDLIHKRWQYHSIGRLMKKLLHTGNSLKLRKEGIRLFLLWYQVLMDNATDECHKTFAGLVPKLGAEELVDQDIFTVRTEGPVSAVEISPLLPPQSGEKTQDNLSSWLLETVLYLMVQEVTKVEWNDMERRYFAFGFLFNKFKQHYLLNIFPHFSHGTNLYDPCLDLPTSRRQSEVFPMRTAVVAVCQDVLVKWLSAYTHCRKQEVTPPHDPDSSGNHPIEDPDNPPGDHQPGSNTSTLSAASFTEKDVTNSSNEGSQDGDTNPLVGTVERHNMTLAMEAHSEHVAIVRGILYGSRENVNIILEIFRQALLFPFSHAGAMRKVINVYKDWFHEDSVELRPVFMLEPDRGGSSSSKGGKKPKATTPGYNNSPVKSESAPMELCFSAGDKLGAAGGHCKPERQYLETMRVCSTSHSNEMEGGGGGSADIFSGAQKVLQLFITHSANVFLLEPEDSSVLLDEQVDMCKRVLNIYRYIVMNHVMEKRTWEQLLMVLLLVTSKVLTTTPPVKRERSLGGKLAPSLFQTLIVSWIKANLQVYISEDLWNQFLQVLSSLTAWVELIREWSKTMTTLTRVLARQVYGLDLNDLPLERLSEQKKKRRGGATRPVSQDIGGDVAGATAAALRKRTFSRGWSRQEPDRRGAPRLGGAREPQDPTQLLGGQDQKLRHKSMPPIPSALSAVGMQQQHQQQASDSSQPSSTQAPGLAGGASFGIRTRSRSGDSTTGFHLDAPSKNPGAQVSGTSGGARGRLGSGSEWDDSLAPPGGALIRSNSDSSLMVNFDAGKGAGEKEDTGSLAEEVLAGSYGRHFDDHGHDDGDDSSTATECNSLQMQLDIEGGGANMESLSMASDKVFIDDDASPTSLSSQSKERWFPLKGQRSIKKSQTKDDSPKTPKKSQTTDDSPKTPKKSHTKDDDLKTRKKSEIVDVNLKGGENLTEKVSKVTDDKTFVVDKNSSTEEPAHKNSSPFVDKKTKESPKSSTIVSETTKESPKSSSIFSKMRKDSSSSPKDGKTTKESPKSSPIFSMMRKDSSEESPKSSLKVSKTKESPKSSPIFGKMTRLKAKGSVSDEITKIKTPPPKPERKSIFGVHRPVSLDVNENNQKAAEMEKLANAKMMFKNAEILQQNLQQQQEQQQQHQSQDVAAAALVSPTWRERKRRGREIKLGRRGGSETAAPRFLAHPGERRGRRRSASSEDERGGGGGNVAQHAQHGQLSAKQRLLHVKARRSKSEDRGMLVHLRSSLNTHPVSIAQIELEDTIGKDATTITKQHGRHSRINKHQQLLLKKAKSTQEVNMADDVESTSMSIASNVTDNVSFTSLDSNKDQDIREVSYQPMETDASSLGADRSDTEVLLRISGSGSSLGASGGSGYDPDSSASPHKSDHPPALSNKSRGSEHAGDSSLDTTGSMDLETVTSPMLNGAVGGRNSPTPDRESLRIDEEDEEVDVVDRSLPKETSPIVGRKEANGVPHRFERRSGAVAVTAGSPAGQVDSATHIVLGAPPGAGPETIGMGLEKARSVLAGGAVVGWTADLAVILWRRMLGALGDINVTPPKIHKEILDSLSEITYTLLRMSKNQGVTRDNTSSPEPPQLIPPSWLVAPWVFEALSLPAEYKEGKLVAYRLLCTMVVRRPEITLTPEQCGRFFFALHHGLVGVKDQDTVNALVRYCGPALFSVPFPGVSVIISDFLHAISSIVLNPEMKDAPRTEAVSTLGSLICLPQHFGGEIPLLDPDFPDSLTITNCPADAMLDRIVGLILKASKKEPSVVARCVSISSLGLYLVQMLSTDPQHHKIKEAISVLMSTLKVNKAVASTACDILHMLCDFVPVLLAELPDLPRWIIETITNTIQYLLPATEHSNADEDKKVLISIMFCLLEWCISVPIDLLMETGDGGRRCLIYKVFRVLVQVVTGSSGQLTPRGSMAWQDFAASLQEDEPDNIESSPQLAHRSPVDPIRDFAGVRAGPHTSSPKAQRVGGPGPAGGAVGGPSEENHKIKLAARTVISHLVNHVGHFPMGGGAARLHSFVHEQHDATLDPTALEDNDGNVDDLTDAIFDAPNVQLFVMDNQTVISFVEIPAVPNVPGGGVTAGLTTGNSICRVILRDVSGRFCWDSCVLYGPPKCRAGSYPADIDMIGKGGSERGKDEDSKKDIPDQSIKSPEQEETTYSCSTVMPRKPNDLPLYDSNKSEEVDNLDELLSFIGHTSPECQLFPGEPLNIPSPSPAALSSPTQDTAMETLLHQADDEAEHTALHQHDATAAALPLEPGPLGLDGGLGGMLIEGLGEDYGGGDSNAATSPFQLCRLFLNQLGFMQWGKRHHFDLLKKSDKLLRELKHFDNLKSRETHKVAVIYVGEGQEDKQSLLTNQGGSKAYEDFVSALGWEVELEHHPGFMGGLQRNKSNGESMPYYATSTREVLFHVATRMPSDTAEDRHRKMRHLGNDEVQIIWSEHSRDYRRGIIPTEFGDVLIIIYPLNNGLFRIHIDRKPEVPFFGPLFNGAILHQRVLPILVRATALNASQVLRAQNKYFQPFYEERARYVETLIQNHKELTTFEDFSAQVFAPVLPQGGDLIGSVLDSGASNNNNAAVQLSSGDGIDGSDRSSLGSSSASAPMGAGADKQSPGNNRKSSKEVGGNELVVPAATVQSFHRRLSFGKAKKSVTKQMLAAQAAKQSVSPPNSPLNNAARK